MTETPHAIELITSTEADRSRRRLRFSLIMPLALALSALGVIGFVATIERGDWRPPTVAAVLLFIGLAIAAIATDRFLAFRRHDRESPLLRYERASRRLHLSTESTDFHHDDIVALHIVHGKGLMTSSVLDRHPPGRSSYFVPLHQVFVETAPDDSQQTHHLVVTFRRNQSAQIAHFAESVSLPLREHHTWANLAMIRPGL